jgi:hypothetical protein
MTPNQAAFVAVAVQEGTKEIKGETDPLKARSIVDSYVMDIIRKNWKQSEIDGLGATDIQEAMNLNPNCPNVPELVPVGPGGVQVLSNQNFVTSNEMARQMEENNAKLLAAMTKIIEASKQPATPPTP